MSQNQELKEHFLKLEMMLVLSTNFRKISNLFHTHATVDQVVEVLTRVQFDALHEIEETHEANSIPYNHDHGPVMGGLYRFNEYQARLVPQVNLGKMVALNLDRVSLEYQKVAKQYGEQHRLHVLA